MIAGVSSPWNAEVGQIVCIVIVDEDLRAHDRFGSVEVGFSVSLVEVSSWDGQRRLESFGGRLDAEMAISWEILVLTINFRLLCMHFAILVHATEVPALDLSTFVGQPRTHEQVKGYWKNKN